MDPDVKKKFDELTLQLQTLAINKDAGKIPNLDLPKFSGNLFGWKEPRCCQVLPVCLTGEALATYEALSTTTKKNWKTLVTELMKKLMRSDQTFYHLNILQNRTQKEDEGIVEFGNDIKKLVDRAFPLIPVPAPADSAKFYTQEQRSGMEVQFFMCGLKTAIKAHLLRKRKPQNLEEAMADAIEEENIQYEIKRSQLKDAAKVTAIKDEIAAVNIEDNWDEGSSQYYPRNYRQNFPNNARYFRNNQNYWDRQNFRQRENYYNNDNDNWELEPEPQPEFENDNDYYDW